MEATSRTVALTSAVLAAIVAICNVAAVPRQFIVVAEMRRLRGLELNQSARFTTDIFDPVESSKAIAVDFDARTGNIYWTDYSKKAIMRTKFNTTGNAIVFPGLETPDGMAIDWIGNHIYYTDSTLLVVGMLSMDGYYALPLVHSQLNEPRAIALDPSHGMMYWTDWGNSPKIERSYMSGQKRELLVNTSLEYPNGLTLDVSSNILYWVDAKLDTLERSRLDGSKRKVLVRYSSSGSIHPFALTRFGSYLYWTDWRLKGVVRVSLDTLLAERIVSTLSPQDSPMGIAIYDADRKTGANGCSPNNGGCKQVCLAEGTGKRCDCSYGTLNSDGLACRVADSFVLYSDIDSVRAITFIPDDDREASYAVMTTEIPFDVDYAADLNIVFWTEQEAQRIMRATHDAGTQPVVVVDADLAQPVSVAYDWMAGNLFFADMEKGIISVCRWNGSLVRDLIVTDLGEPTSLALDPDAGYMYWTDQKTKFNRIERSHMSGDSREVIVSSDFLSAPRGLSLDLTGRKMYWVEHHANKIGVADLDGHNRVDLISNHHLLEQPVRLTHYSGYLYVSSEGVNSILRCNENGSNLTQFRRTRDTPDGIIVVHPAMQQGANACSQDNGGCTQLCLAVPGGRVCACTVDNYTDCLPDVNATVRGTGHIDLGQRAALHCTIADKGVPISRVTWLRDGIVVSMQYDVANDDVELKLEAVTVSDAGEYTCAVENEYGKVTSDPQRIVVVDQHHDQATSSTSTPSDLLDITNQYHNQGTNSSPSDSLSMFLVVGVAGGSLVVVFVLVVIGILLCRRYRKRRPRIIVMNPVFNVTTGSLNRQDEPQPPPYDECDAVKCTAVFVEEVASKAVENFS